MYMIRHSSTVSCERICRTTAPRASRRTAAPQRHDAALDQQDVLLVRRSVGLLKNGAGNRPCPRRRYLRGTRHPRQHAQASTPNIRAMAMIGRPTKCGGSGSSCRTRTTARLREADVQGRSGPARRFQNEDQHRDQRTDDAWPWDSFKMVLHVHDVNAHHLHTRVEQEDTARQHEVVEFRQVGEEALVTCPCGCVRRSKCR